MKNFNLSGAYKIVIMAMGCMMYASCGTLEAPPFLSPLVQTAVYNGMPQPVQAKTGTSAPFVITYYNSGEDLRNRTGGSSAAPVAAGTYYVRIQRPEGNGYAAGPELSVVYTIVKCPVVITADSKQEVFYDGFPKRVNASVDVPVQLSAVYFPSPESRSQTNLSRRGTGGASVQGYTRVERPPAGPGTFYVTVYYPGDENYESAFLDIDFTIKIRSAR